MTVIERIINAVQLLAPKAKLGVLRWEDDQGQQFVEEVWPKQSEARGETLLDFGPEGKFRVIVERWNG